MSMMTSINVEACKKRKRIRAKVFGFHTFGECAGCPISPTGAFRDNIRLFLRECAQLEDYNVEGMPIWCTFLVYETANFLVPLYTIEENVKDSPQPHCDYCRCTGWNDHFVSRRKYHVIIPNDGDWNKPLEMGVFDVQTHLLHGLIHCNGFGHMLCINGIEGGSSYLCGREIMDLWDRICTVLRARKITVEDVSKKKGMDLRLLHGVAYGHPWFGRWGYKFCHGSFGVTEHKYNRAIEILSSLTLDNIIQDFRDTDEYKEIKQIFQCYRDLSETQLITLKDLLRFMLTFKSCASAKKKSIMATSADSTRRLLHRNKSLQVKNYKSVNYRRFSSLIANMDSRWSARRLESAAEVIVNALKEKKAEKLCRGGNGMSRQDVRDAARMHIGDTGLLDYVLKSMNNVIVGRHIVQRAVNPNTRLLEYTIHELDEQVLEAEPEPEIEIVEDHIIPPVLALDPGADVCSEVVYLYMNVLLNYPGSKLVALATQVVLDSKHFVKEWPFKDEEDQLLRFICKVMPSFDDQKAKFAAKVAPGELVVLPLHATIYDLKRAIECALRDTYCIMEKLVVTDVENMEEMEDEEVLFGAMESGAEVYVRVYGIDSDSKLRYQGGDDNWMVRCHCGAEDDDGERMVECDICEVWQHTRCNGIQDSETVPLLFVCPACRATFAPQRNEPSLEFESSVDLFLAPETEYGIDPRIQDDVGNGMLL